MLVVVEQAFDDAERGDVVVLGLFDEGEDEFVAGATIRVSGLAADGFEALEQVLVARVEIRLCRLQSVEVRSRKYVGVLGQVFFSARSKESRNTPEPWTYRFQKNCPLRW